MNKCRKPVPSIRFLQFAALTRAISFLLLFSLSPSIFASTRVLVIGGSEGYMTSQEAPFAPQPVADHLRAILEQDPNVSKPVTVQLEDTAAKRSLMAWYYWPDQRSRIAALLKEEWDHVILLEDPFFASRHPQIFFEGVHSISKDARAGGAAIWLVMQWSSGSAELSTFAEAAYRVGDGTEAGVIPAGYAWQDVPAANKDTGVRPTPKGAYVTAAAAFSRIFDRSATASSYVPQGQTQAEANLIANVAWDTVQAAQSQLHYTGAYVGPTHFISPPIKKRSITFYGQGTSTENGMNLALREALPLAGVKGVSVANTANPSMKQDVWYQRNAVNLTRGHSVGYFVFQQYSGAKTMVDGINALTYGPANTVMGYSSTPGYPVFHLPVFVGLSRIRTTHAEIAVQADTTHLSAPVHHSTAAMMIAQATGRCAVGDEPSNRSSEDWEKWYGRKTGYEVAWQHATLRSRVPGFEVRPPTALNVTPNLTVSSDETLTVRFLYPPTAPVTVNVEASLPAAVLMSPSQLTFTPENFKQTQTIRFRALPGAQANQPVLLQVTTSSTDPVFHGLSDPWDYNIVRSTTTTSPVTVQPPLSVNVAEDTPTVINLGVPGANAANTTIIGPTFGTWSAQTFTYTPNPDYYGPDSFTFVVNNGSTITTGRVDLVIADVPDATVALIAPAPNASYEVPASIRLAVSGHWQGGEVKFFANNEPIGTAISPPWQVDWQPKHVGQASLRAVVRDRTGTVLQTPAVSVTLTSRGPFWIGGEGAIWSGATNWSTGTEPQAGEQALFNNVELDGVRTVNLQGQNSAAGLVFAQSGNLSPRWIMGPDALGSPILDPTGPKPPGWLITGQAGSQLRLTGQNPTIEVTLPRPPYSIAPIHPGWIYQELEPIDYVATIRTPFTSDTAWRKAGTGWLLLDHDNEMPQGFQVDEGEVHAATPGATGVGPIFLAPGGILRVADIAGLNSNFPNAISLTGNQAATYRIGPGLGSKLTLSGSINGTGIHADSTLTIGHTDGAVDLLGTIDLGNRELIFSNTWPYATSSQETRIIDATIRAGNLTSVYTSQLGADTNTFFIGGRSDLKITNKVELVCAWGTGTFGEQAKLEADQLDVYLTQFTLTGGTVSVKNLHTRRTAATSNGKVAFDGVTLQARESTSSFITSEGGFVHINDGGLNVDTATHTVTLPVGFDTGSQYGGIRKRGSGKLILNPDPAVTNNPNSTNRFRGSVMVLEGTLETGHALAFTATRLHEVRAGAILHLRHNAINDNAGLDIRTGGTVELAAGINDTISTLYFDGVEQPAGTWGAPGSGAERTDARFAGTGLLTVTSSGTGNKAPVANPDAYSTPAGTLLSVPNKGVLTNDTDANKNNLFAFVERQPSHGTLALSTGGNFTYQPNPGYSGTDSFVYYAFDGKVNSLPTTVNLAVEAPPNQPPVLLQAASASPAAPSRLTGTTVQVAASDPDGDLLGFHWTQTSGPGIATFQNAAASTTAVSFGAPGDYVLRVQITDGRGGVLASSLSVSVSDAFDSWASDKPFADAQSALPGADPDGDGLSNLLEYAFGTEPLSPDRSGFPTAEIEGPNLTMTYRKNPLAGEILLAPEASSNLQNWQTENVIDEFLRVEDSTEFRKATVPLPNHGPIFLRLKVSPRP